MRHVLIRRISGATAAIMALAVLATPLAAHAMTMGKLDTAKEKVCAMNTSRINVIVANAKQRYQTNFTLFNNVLQRIEQFYTNKKLSVSNYDQLLATVNTKKDAVTTALNAFKAEPVFSCGTGNPGEQVMKYQTEATSVRTALQSYRSAIKDLLAAVKTAAQEAK
jgi:hypothetical protein